jgi:hypothetical protein
MRAPQPSFVQILLLPFLPAFFVSDAPPFSFLELPPSTPPAPAYEPVPGPSIQSFSTSAFSVVSAKNKLAIYPYARRSPFTLINMCSAIVK